MKKGEQMASTRPVLFFFPGAVNIPDICSHMFGKMNRCGTLLKDYMSNNWILHFSEMGLLLILDSLSWQPLEKSWVQSDIAIIPLV